MKALANTEQNWSSLSIAQHFGSLPDPRTNKNIRHLLDDIVIISILAVICGADDFKAIQRFGRAKEDWLVTFLVLPNGIPSHDTFRAVFCAMSPTAFQECFCSWVNALIGGLDSQIVAIDGKTVRGSKNRRHGKSAIHMVSAWAADNKLVLGQVKTEEKSNEITAIPELLKVLDIRGCIVTTDAMGCQGKITKQIIFGGADYVLALKENHKKLYDAVEAFFSEADSNGYETIDVDYHEVKESGHGRIETRRYWTAHAPEDLPNKAKFDSLRTIGMVESTRVVDGNESIEHRYYISSIDNDAEKFGVATRDHWGVENPLHWRLDVGFREDECRLRTGNAAENFSTLRRIALNLLTSDKATSLGIKNKRLAAGWDNDYLIKLLKLC